MIPVRLSIKGLYSYREKQEIDFHTLMASQLFGIFGAVGSGKSSILEAMMFILFDQSDRLTAKDNRYYNMLNLQSNEIEIDFVFRAGVRSKEQYRFYFLAKRKKNEFEKVEVKDRTYYRWQNDAWTPMHEGESTASILGMSYQNFMQTIIIPQGRFREFIDLTPTYRTRMLKELFHLERFDLTYNTNVLMSKCKSEIDQLEGELKGVGEVSAEEMKTLEHEIEQGEKKLKKNEGILKDLEKENQQLEQLKGVVQKLEAVQEQLQQLQEQKPNFDAREKRLIRYEKAYQFFKEKLDAFEEGLEQSKQKNNRIQQCGQEIQTKEAELKEAEKKLNEAKNAYESRDKIRQQCDELRVLIDIQYLKKNWQEAREKETKAEESFQQLKKQKDAHAKEKEDIERQITKLETKIPDTKILYELSHWHNTKQDILQEQVGKKKEINTHQAEKQKILAVCQQFSDDFALLSGVFSFETTYQKIADEEKRLKLEEEKLTISLQDFQVKQELANYARELKEGEPCPLCGATHHLQIAHADTATEAVQAHKKKLRELADKIAQLGEFEKRLGKLENELDLKNTLLVKSEAEKQQIDSKLAKHQQAFTWKEYEGKPAEEIATLIKDAEQQQHLINNLKREQVLKSSIEEHEKAFEQKQKQQEEAKKSAYEIEVIIQTKKSSLELMPFEKFEKYTRGQLSNSLKKGENMHKEVQQAYEQSQAVVNKLNLELNRMKTQKEADEAHLKELVDKTEKLIREVRHLCIEHTFSGPEEVQQLLQKKLDIEAERKKIDEYKEQLHSTWGSYQQLRKEAEDKVYNEHYHQELIYQLKTLKEEVDHQKETLTLQRKQLADCSEKLEKRAKLGKALDQLTNRQENLKEMSGLFRGSGFVNYASHIYLSDLCRAANERFMKLTKNNLSLELNENNDFIVRDYLNDGKTRLLKTLSGGQTFQAALCLALALAENVKSLHQAEQSFFFLDEGFGALDKTSLRIVFDTLKSLQKENRIVGVISHVEELQQEIDVFLKIENDRERGSLIHYSWQ